MVYAEGPHPEKYTRTRKVRIQVRKQRYIRIDDVRGGSRLLFIDHKG